MQKKEKIDAFIRLSHKISNLSEAEISSLCANAKLKNGWFTEESVKNALNGITHMLEKEKLKRWAGDYPTNPLIPNIVGVIMAGNIPLVGFHDVLCVLFSGNFAALKPSSSDLFLTQKIIEWIVEIEPRFKKNIEIRQKLTGIEALIATGSDNTARYFEYYFRDVPKVIRKNRTSVALLTGKETDEEKVNLGKDIFSYFGLGCRNVSKIYTPRGYDIRELLSHFENYSDIIHHHKYANNYDYYKAIYLVNKTPHLDTGFLLVTNSDELVSPISNLYHQEYEDVETLTTLLTTQNEKIQCVVGHDFLPFGTTQRPELWDYADNVDTMKFLTELD